MTQLDPMVAVKDVQASAQWYQRIFKFKNAHGGDHFAVLTTEADEVVLCLHAWQADQHPTMANPVLPAGNGLLLYFRTADWKEIRQNLTDADWAVEEDLHVNPNSLRQEFSFRDPDGYFLTVTELHQYEG